MGDMADLLMDQAFDEWCEMGCPRILPDVRNDEWCTADGEVLKIEKMRTSHLCNVLNYIKRFKKEKKVGGERMIRLRAEANKRGLERGADGVYREPHGFTKITVDTKCRKELICPT